jgi:hypothetical protein
MASQKLLLCNLHSPGHCGLTRSLAGAVRTLRLRIGDYKRFIEEPSQTKGTTDRESRSNKTSLRYVVVMLL